MLFQPLLLSWRHPRSSHGTPPDIGKRSDWGQKGVKNPSEEGGMLRWDVSLVCPGALWAPAPWVWCQPSKMAPIQHTLFSACASDIIAAMVCDQRRWTDGLCQISRQLWTPSARGSKQREVCTSDVIYEGLAMRLHKYTNITQSFLWSEKWSESE